MNKAVIPLFNTDAYKLDHRRQYPEGTTAVLSNYTARGSRIEGVDYTVHFGLQAFLVELAESFEDFFKGDIDVIATEYEAAVNSVLGPNTVGSDHIRALHKLGYLPLLFCAVPEGTRVPIRVPSFTIENTHDDFFWLVNYFETWISASYWQPSTTATIAYHFRELLNAAALETTGSTDGVEFQGHDFSYRGMAGTHAAAASSLGHLLSFQGSDTLSAMAYADKNYGKVPWIQRSDDWVLGSVPATEHSVMCAGGSDEGDEQKTFERLLNLYPAGIVSVVSDTWDLWNVLTVILPNLKDQILARDGKLVIRPDSGDPVDIICGTAEKNWVKITDRSVLKPEEKGVIELLWDVFGGTVNAQGYKVLDPHIGAIYGDSITPTRAQQIIDRLKAKGFASTNIVFGVGSFTYQYQTRDTFSSAIKATWVEINGVERAIFKAPVTDSGMKKSAKGRLAVIDRGNGLELVDNLSTESWMEVDRIVGDMLNPIWHNGEFLKWQTLGDIRKILHP